MPQSKRFDMVNVTWGRSLRAAPWRTLGFDGHTAARRGASSRARPFHRTIPANAWETPMGNAMMAMSQRSSSDHPDPLNAGTPDVDAVATMAGWVAIGGSI